MKVLVADPIADEGIDILRGYADVDIRPGLKPEEIIAIIGGYEALAVRSQTRVSAKVIEAGKKLQVIARAGVGVDNIDVAAATRRDGPDAAPCWVQGCRWRPWRACWSTDIGAWARGPPSRGR